MSTNIHSDLAEVAENLYSRWQDERKYENFADYIAHMQTAMPKGARITKMTSRPFRVEYTLVCGTRRWITVSSRTAQWGGYAPRAAT